MGAAPFVLNGLPLQTFAKNSDLQRLAADSTNDKVLVLIQLHGGNDGLNTFIPLDQYSQYYMLRPNLAISKSGNRQAITLDTTLGAEQQLGLHPDTLAFKSMYDSGRMNIVQNVAYENINGSHFRSRDVWFMGGDYDDYLASGWMGRYLDHYYPGYPESYPNEQMPDPLALEIGNSVSLAFHRDAGIPTSLSVQNPQQFYELITNVGGEPPESVADTYYGKELQWIMDIEEKSNQYAGRLKEVFEKGSNSSVEYPDKYPLNAPNNALNNPLSSQLKMIARLLNGGVKTKIFLAKIGGFDNHAQQVESYDSSLGTHAALLYHLSTAVKAFHDDLRKMGLQDRVMTATFSEFGRRAASNGSYGTDHGKAAPMMLFGDGVKPGVTGKNADLNDLDRNNLRHEFDYRQVFSSVLIDWMGASDEAITKTRFQDFKENRLEVVRTSPILSNKEFFDQRFRLENCFPNPVLSQTTFTFHISNRQTVRLSLYDKLGRKVRTLFEGVKEGGTHQLEADLSGLAAGVYVYELLAGERKTSKKLTKSS